MRMSGIALRACRETPAQLPLFPRETVIRSLRVNGKEGVPVVKDGWFHAELVRPGSFVVDADVDVATAFDGREYALALRKPPVARSRALVESETAIALRIPGVPGHIAVGEGARSEIAVGPQREFTLIWHEPRPPVVRHGLFSATLSAAWHVRDGVLAARMALDGEIVGGTRDRIAVRLPTGSVNATVSGALVRDTRRHGTELDIFLQRPLAGRVNLTLSFDLPRAEGDLVELPVPELPGGALASEGWLVVAHQARGLLLEHEIEGLRPVSDLDVPARILGLAEAKPIYLYQRTRRNSLAIFDAVAREPFPLVDTVALQADAHAIVRTSGEEMVRIRYDIRNRRQPFLSLRLPDNAELVSTEVGGRTVSVAREGRHLRIPLPASIQTLDGPVPFPVEIVYVRRGEGRKKTGELPLPLPTLANVPVSTLRATVFLPANATVLHAGGRARPVAAFSDALLPTASLLASQSRPPRTEPAIAHALAGHSYRRGTDAYRAHRLEESESFLSRVATLAPDTAMARRAGKLLRNIRIGRGEEQATAADRQAKAQVAAIRENLAQYNPQLEARQLALIQDGLLNIEAGNATVGIGFLREADQLGERIVRRSGSAARQRSLERVYRVTLTQAEQEQTRREILRRRLATLRNEIGTVTREPGERAERFGAWLHRLARAEELDIAHAHHAALGFAEFGNDPAAAASASANNAVTDEQNRRIEAVIGILSSALDRARAVPAEPVPAPTHADAAAVRRLLSEFERRNEQTRQDIARLHRNPAVAEPDEIEADLVALARRISAARNAFRLFDNTLDRDFARLQAGLGRLRAQFERVRSEQRRAPYAHISLTGLVPHDAAPGHRAIKKFLAANVLPEREGDRVLYRAESGTLAIHNTDAHVARLREAIRNLRLNDGLVVPMAGMDLPVSNAASLPVLGAAFVNRTASGRPYALLDLAQTDTLAHIAYATAPPDRRPAAPSYRQAIVGADSFAGSLPLALTRSDAESNTVSMDGVSVCLPRDTALAVDFGTHVSLVLAGELRHWQEPGLGALPDLRPIPSGLLVPVDSVPVRFEALLLAADETPDIELTVQTENEKPFRAIERSRTP